MQIVSTILSPFLGFDYSFRFYTRSFWYNIPKGFSLTVLALDSLWLNFFIHLHLFCYDDKVLVNKVSGELLRPVP
jgi:hypothetical protein